MNLEQPYLAQEIMLNGHNSYVGKTWLCGVCLREMLDIKTMARGESDPIMHVCYNKHCKQVGIIFVKKD